MDNQDIAAAKKDSIRRANKRIAAEKRKEKADKAAIEALEKRIEREEIKKKLNNDKLSKEAKDELLRQKARLDGEIETLKKVKNEVKKANNKEKQKGRRGRKTVDKAKAYQDSMKTVLDRQAEQDWELHNQKAKEIKAKIRLQR